jgi:glutathione peroxidase
MKRGFVVLIGLCLIWGCEGSADKNVEPVGTMPAGSGQQTEANEMADQKSQAKTASSALDFVVQDIEGKDVPLSKYRGKVVMIVNVASKCGLTPQYRELQQLHEVYSGQGLAILGFPANEFMGQEPGTNAEIRQFCTSKYGVEFDMFAKVVVKGKGKCELYEYLTSADSNPEFGGDLKWNFTKFLLGKDGQVIARFEPRVRPSDPKVVSAIEQAL